MKVLNLLLAVLFVVFAFVQINDPDPALWILIYGVMAVSCVLAAFGYYYPKILIGILILYTGYSLTYWSSISQWLKADNKAMLFDDVAKMENLYIEESREFLGLFICILVLIMHLLMARYRTPRLRA
jgi:hypothetical protein